MVKMQDLVDLIERVDEQHYPAIRDFIYRSVHVNGIHLLYRPQDLQNFTRDQSLRQVEAVYDIALFAEDHTETNRHIRAKKHAIRALRARFGMELSTAERELEHWLQTRSWSERF